MKLTHYSIQYSSYCSSFASDPALIYQYSATTEAQKCKNTGNILPAHKTNITFYLITP